MRFGIIFCYTKTQTNFHKLCFIFYENLQIYLALIVFTVAKVNSYETI